MRYWPWALGLLLGCLFFLFVAAEIMSRRACEKAGGAYLSRDNVCLRKDLVIKP